jgi:hypothetical protein
MSKYHCLECTKGTKITNLAERQLKMEGKPLTASQLSKLKEIVLKSCTNLELMGETLRRQPKNYYHQVNLKKPQGGNHE